MKWIAKDKKDRNTEKKIIKKKEQKERVAALKNIGNILFVLKCIIYIGEHRQPCLWVLMLQKELESREPIALMINQGLNFCRNIGSSILSKYDIVRINYVVLSVFNIYVQTNSYTSCKRVKK